MRGAIYEQVTATPLWHELVLPAEQYYDSDLQYHNWEGHALEVAENVCGIVERLSQRGVRDPKLHPGMLAVAAAWHDAGYAEDHRVLGFDTKEHYSAHLAREFLADKGCSPVFINDVGEAILAARHQAVRQDMHELALHYADVANIGDDYPVFAQHAHDLYLEAKAANPKLLFHHWVRGTGEFLQQVIHESKNELPRLGEPIIGPRSFPQRADQNRRHLHGETFRRLQAAAKHQQ